IRLGVPDVQNLANPPGAALAEERLSKPMQPLLEPFQVVRSRPITRAESKLLSVLVEPEVCQLRFAERGRTLENRIQPRLRVRRRGGDPPQDLGRGRLLLLHFRLFPQRVRLTLQSFRQALLKVADCSTVAPWRLAGNREL